MYLISGCSFGAGDDYSPGDQKTLEVELGQVVSDPHSKLQSGSLPELAQRRSVAEEELTKIIPASAFKSFSAHRGSINSIDASNDSLVSYTGGEDGKVLRHKLVRDGAGASSLSSELIYQSTEPIFAVQINPDNRLLAVAQTGLVFVIDTEKHRVIHKLDRANGRIHSLAWDPTGKLLAIGRSNGEVLVWRVKNGKRAGKDNDEAVETYRGLRSPVIAIAFHPNARVFFAAHRDGAIYLWRLIRTELEMGIRDEDALRDLNNRGRRNLLTTGFNARLEDIWMRDDGKFLLVAAVDGRILKLKVRGLVLSELSKAGSDMVSSVRTIFLDRDKLSARESSAAGVAAAAYRDRQLRFWCLDSLDKHLVAASPPLADAAEKLAVSGVGAYLWAGQKSGNLLAFDADFLLKSPNLSREFQGCSRLVLNEAG